MAYMIGARLKTQEKATIKSLWYKRYRIFVDKDEKFQI